MRSNQKEGPPPPTLRQSAASPRPREHPLLCCCSSSVRRPSIYHSAVIVRHQGGRKGMTPYPTRAPLQREPSGELRRTDLEGGLWRGTRLSSSRSGMPSPSRPCRMRRCQAPAPTVGGEKPAPLRRTSPPSLSCRGGTPPLPMDATLSSVALCRDPLLHLHGCELIDASVWSR